jgi:hypothetical protein
MTALPESQPSIAWSRSRADEWLAEAGPARRVRPFAAAVEMAARQGDATLPRRSGEHISGIGAARSRDPRNYACRQQLRN